MIKHLRFDAAPLVDAPIEVRPCRVAVGATLPQLSGPEPRHGGITVEWFADADHLRRFQTWSGGSAAGVVVDEVVVRGKEWLTRRWIEGGPRWKHVALARRADGLGRAEFSARWRAHAGRVGQVTIPDGALGRAYVQNHPAAEGAPYDAVNEVYFDDEAGLRARIDFFRANPTQPGDLFGASWFLAVREEVLSAAR